MVVWLAPHEVVAKVGVLAHSREVLGRESEVCSFLASVGAPVARPIGPLRLSVATGWPTSLWERVRPTGTDASDRGLAEVLRRVHVALTDCPVELPSYLVALDGARTTLFDDERMASLRPEDLQMLRATFEEWSARARTHTTRLQPLHGEPHLHNVVTGAKGLVLLDFEAVCVGPPEVGPRVAAGRCRGCLRSDRPRAAEGAADAQQRTGRLDVVLGRSGPSPDAGAWPAPPGGRAQGAVVNRRTPL